MARVREALLLLVLLGAAATAVMAGDVLVTHRVNGQHIHVKGGGPTTIINNHNGHPGAAPTKGHVLQTVIVDRRNTNDGNVAGGHNGPVNIISNTNLHGIGGSGAAAAADKAAAAQKKKDAQQRGGAPKKNVPPPPEALKVPGLVAIPQRAAPKKKTDPKGIPVEDPKTPIPPSAARQAVEKKAAAAAAAGGSAAEAAAAAAWQATQAAAPPPTATAKAPVVVADTSKATPIMTDQGWATSTPAPCGCGNPKCEGPCNATPYEAETVIDHSGKEFVYHAKDLEPEQQKVEKLQIELKTEREAVSKLETGPGLDLSG